MSAGTTNPQDSAATVKPARGERPRTSMEDPGSLLARIDDAGPSDLEARLDAWLATPLDDLIAAHGSSIAASQASRFGRRVILFAPLYVSSACLNDCVYCGFRRSRRGARVKLGPDEALREARHLAAQGHRTLDLVSGELPTERFVDEVCELCARILAGSAIERINLNVGVLSAAQYGRLRASGARACHVYQ
jgi:2-iminoacetate synthase